MVSCDALGCIGSGQRDDSLVMGKQHCFAVMNERHNICICAVRRAGGKTKICNDVLVRNSVSCSMGGYRGRAEMCMASSLQ